MGKKAVWAMPRKNGGFTLVEILIAMATVSLVIGAIYGVFLSSNRSYYNQDKVVDAQQRVRIALDIMTANIRMAGLDPLGTAGTGFELADTTKLRLTSDVDMDGTISEGANERITYDLVADAPNNTNTLNRGTDETTTSESWQPFVNNVDTVSFGYLDANGNTIAVPVAISDLNNIRTVVIIMTVEEKDVRGETFTRTLMSQVSCRNTGF